MLGDISSFRATKKSEGKQSSHSFIHSALEIPSSSGTLIILNVCGGNYNITINNTNKKLLEGKCLLRNLTN